MNGKGLEREGGSGHTFGAALPVADANLVGRSYLLNNTLQYRVLRKFCPKLNSIQRSFKTATTTA